MREIRIKKEIEISNRKPPSLSVLVEVLFRNARCENCKKSVTRKTSHIDHKIPLELGGSNNSENLQVLCIDCHKEKTAIDIAAIREASRRKKFDTTGRSKSSKVKKIKSIPFSKKMKKKLSGKVILRDEKG